MDTRWMTYDELAVALRIAPDSARRLVARRKWPRQVGNDGKARVGVPTEKLTPDTSPDIRSDVPPNATPTVAPDVRADITSAVRVLTEHIDRLQKELADIKSERDVERARAAQVDALQVALEIERQRVSEWQAVADRWAQQAERMTATSRRSWWPFWR